MFVLIKKAKNNVKACVILLKYDLSGYQCWSRAEIATQSRIEITNLGRLEIANAAADSFL